MKLDTRLVIKNATLYDGRLVDVLIEKQRISAIGRFDEGIGATLDAKGGLLLPGLHDHHVHIAATAAALSSVACGPPQVNNAIELQEALSKAGTGWLRGVGYHEIVAGEIDRDRLDKIAPSRPIRIQHRSGRQWIFNSLGLEAFLSNVTLPVDGLDLSSGKLFDQDVLLRSALSGTRLSFDSVGTMSARFGITGLTDLSPSNNNDDAAYFAYERHRGALPQKIVVGGKLELGFHHLDPKLTIGPMKLHLHEANLPDYYDTLAAIRTAHERQRGVAVHCVSEAELVFCLTAFREAGTIPGDRIEHASVAPNDLIKELAELELCVVVQPNFVTERGDAYYATIPSQQWPALYRLRSFLESGMRIIGGTDTPFGSSDPWAAMSAAVSRRTSSGREFGAMEALTPEQALELFLADPNDLTQQRQLAIGKPADLCLLKKAWSSARNSLSAELVRTTIIDGRIVYNRVDEAPI